METKQMTDKSVATASAIDAINSPLRRIAAELDKCSPELRALIRNALAGSNGEMHAVSDRNKAMAAMRLNEANNSWTKEAKARRAAVVSLSVRPDTNGAIQDSGWDIQQTGAGDWRASIVTPDGDYEENEYFDTQKAALRHARANPRT